MEAAAQIEQIKMRVRTASDVMSGVNISSCYKTFPNLPVEDLQKHFQMFKSYDIDDSGFITPGNLLDVVEAMGLGLTEEQVVGMIEEVAVLSGHSNDGYLSFRDFMACIQYERTAEAHNTGVDAEEELLSLRIEEEPPVVSSPPADDKGLEQQQAQSMPPPTTEGAAEHAEAAEAAEEPPKMRMRHSSFSVMNSIATSRIQTFQQAVEVAVTEKNKPLPTKFTNRLEKFKRVEAGEAMTLNNEKLQESALKSKLRAFEQASKKDPVAFKKSWKNVRPGSWKPKTVVAGGVAAPVSLKERLALDSGKM